MFMKGLFKRGGNLGSFSCWLHRQSVLFGMWVSWKTLLLLLFYTFKISGYFRVPTSTCFSDHPKKYRVCILDTSSSLFSPLWWLLVREVCNGQTVIILSSLQLCNSFRCFLDLGTTDRAVIYRWQQAIPPSMAFLKSILGFLNFAYTVLVLNYSCVGFMVRLFRLFACSRRVLISFWCYNVLGRSWACTRRLPRMEACTTLEASFPSRWSYLVRLLNPHRLDRKLEKMSKVRELDPFDGFLNNFRMSVGEHLLNDCVMDSFELKPLRRIMLSYCGKFLPWFLIH